MNLNIKEDITKLSVSDKINIFEDAAKHSDQVEIPVQHYFVPGVYIREIFVPKGVILVGKIHKYPQFHVITKGELSILLEDKIERIKAPYNIMSKAGAKRIAYAHEDTIWLMVHGTHETNLERIENHFIASSEEEYLKFCNEEKSQLSLFKDEKC